MIIEYSNIDSILSRAGLPENQIDFILQATHEKEKRDKEEFVDKFLSKSLKVMLIKKMREDATEAGIYLEIREAKEFIEVMLNSYVQKIFGELNE